MPGEAGCPQDYCPLPFRFAAPLFRLLYRCGKRFHQSGVMPMGGFFSRIAFFFDQSGVMPLDCGLFLLLVSFIPLGSLLQSGLVPLEMLIPE
jgi:hypothetical protein